MSHCPQDGGFVGSAGCAHPHHQHSELVKKILAEKPKMISPNDAETALKEGFYVDNPYGQRVGFGERLLAHLESHPKTDSNARKARLAFAVETVRHSDKSERNHKGFEGRTLYAKAFDAFGMIVVSAKGNGSVENVFTIVPKRKEGKKG